MKKIEKSARKLDLMQRNGIQNEKEENRLKQEIGEGLLEIMASDFYSEGEQILQTKRDQMMKDNPEILQNMPQLPASRIVFLADRLIQMMAAIKEDGENDKLYFWQEYLTDLFNETAEKITDTVPTEEELREMEEEYPENVVDAACIALEKVKESFQTDRFESNVKIAGYFCSFVSVEWVDQKIQKKGVAAD